MRPLPPRLRLDCGVTAEKEVQQSAESVKAEFQKDGKKAVEKTGPPAKAGTGRKKPPALKPPPVLEVKPPGVVVEEEEEAMGLPHVVVSKDRVVCGT